MTLRRADARWSFALSGSFPLSALGRRFPWGTFGSPVGIPTFPLSALDFERRSLNMAGSTRVGSERRASSWSGELCRAMPRVRDRLEALRHRVSGVRTRQGVTPDLALLAD